MYFDKWLNLTDFLPNSEKEKNQYRCTEPVQILSGPAKNQH